MHLLATALSAADFPVGDVAYGDGSHFFPKPGIPLCPRVHIFRAVASSMAPVQRCRSIRLGCPALPSGHDPVMIGLPGLTGQGTILFNEVAPGGAEDT